MKQLRYIAIAALTGMTFASCTKVIDVNLDNTEPKIVIEANLADNTGPNVVKVTRTIDIDKDNNFPGVSGAIVTMKDDAGYEEVLKEKEAGVYITNTPGVQGRTYTLTVMIDGETYTAISKMPVKVPYDSLGQKEVMTFDGPQLFPTVYYRDPVGTGNYYRAIRYVNGIADGELYIESDEFIDGKHREAVLFNGQEKEELQPGDIVTVEMQCLDRQMYEYLLEREEADGSSESAAPSNPTGNISNKALGYFSAHTSEIKVLDLQ
ncbi:MAG: DUF4249 domain-containing protein [Chitinophagales bacterium]|nr:DUF4249 domain-containing protein [Chitinophagales bacterium]